MKPKEKAKQLVETFKLYWMNSATHFMAKKCALFAVDEIIEALRKEDNPQTKDYWVEVKNIIENDRA